mmetsp:Transcript_11959/g.51494  ORF Transcript_11959/g.51494 Transcript_11959/m.51494 type:complete len:424 (-) Transcript_11959:982-2253(-)
MRGQVPARGAREDLLPPYDDHPHEQGYRRGDVRAVRLPHGLHGPQRSQGEARASGKVWRQGRVGHALRGCPLRSHPRVWRRVRAHRVRAAQDQEPEREGQARGGQGEDLPQGFHRRDHAPRRAQGRTREARQAEDSRHHDCRRRRHRLLRAREAGDVPLRRRVRRRAHRPVVPRVRRGRLARALREVPRGHGHLPRRGPEGFPAHPRLASPVGVLPCVRPGNPHALGPPVPHRVPLRLHHLHGLLHRRAPAPGRGHVRKIEALGGPGGYDRRRLGRRVPRHRTQRRLEIPQGPARRDARGVQLLVPVRPARVRQGPHPEPPHVCHLQSHRDLGGRREQVAARLSHQRAPAPQRREDVQVHRQLQDAEDRHRGVQRGRHEVRAGGRRRRHRGCQLCPRHRQRGDSPVHQGARVDRVHPRGVRAG